MRPDISEAPHGGDTGGASGVCVRADEPNSARSNTPREEQKPRSQRSNKRDRKEFVWRGLGLCIGRRTPMLELVRDATGPHLFRIRYRDGWTSSPANLTRAKDAAYGHARYLIGRLEASGAAPAARTVSGPPSEAA
jgi:hypothetical protein